MQNKTELLNKFARDPEERLLLARVMDKLELCRTRSIPAWTQFLSQGERGAAEGLIAAQGHPEHLFWGGYEGAERTLCVFLPDWLSREDFLEDPEGPLGAVTLSFPADAKLTHRDFLGALLGLGVTREKMGDLLVGEGRCQAVVLRELEQVLLTQLEQVGRQRVRAASCPISKLDPSERKVKPIRDTVAALRLDAVASSAFSVSRARMQSMISSKKVALNGRECDKPDRLVEEGDTLTCRGMGKCLLKQVSGTSKKGRIMILLERYL